MSNFVLKLTLIWRILTMAISNEQLQKIKSFVKNNDGDTLSEKEAEQARAIFAPEVAALKTEIETLKADKAALSADIQAVADALTNPDLPPVETADAVAEVVTESEAGPDTVTPVFPS